MKTNFTTKESLVNNSILEISKIKVEDRKINNKNKKKEDNIYYKNVKIPTFIPQSFQDYVEKLSEKSSLWSRKYFMIFLKLKKLYLFDKKPGNNMKMII
jgi:hypothetical protein